MDKPNVILDYDLATKVLGCLVTYGLSLPPSYERDLISGVVDEYIEVGDRCGVNAYIEFRQKEIAERVRQDLREAGINVIPNELFGF